MPRRQVKERRSDEEDVFFVVRTRAWTRAAREAHRVPASDVRSIYERPASERIPFFFV